MSGKVSRRRALRRVGASLWVCLGPGLLAGAEVEYYRQADGAGVAAMLQYARVHLLPAVRSRCDAAGVDRPVFSWCAYHGSGDARLYEGLDGWSTPEGAAGLPAGPLRYRDRDGNRVRSADETLWLDLDADALFLPGEPVLAGSALQTPGAYGQPFRERVCYCDRDGSGTWDADEDVWCEPAAADAADLARLHTAVLGLVRAFANPLEESSWDGGTSLAPAWTDGALLAAIGQEALRPPPLALDDSLDTARALAAWLRQSVAIVDLLRVRPGPAWTLTGREKSAGAWRGPYYALRCSTTGVIIVDGQFVCVPEEHTLRLCEPSAVSEFWGLRVPSSDLDFALGWGWSKPVADPNACYWALGCQADEAALTGRSWLTANQEDFLLHAAGFVPNPEPCGSYSLTRFCLHYDCGLGRVLTSEFTTTATVAPETPPRSVFETFHSAAAGAESDVASTLILPTASDLAGLFAAEWAAAEWRAADGGEVLARRRETDTSGWWSDANQSGIRQTVRETLAAATLPAPGAADVYVRVLEKTGTPDRFADRAAGRYWFERTLGGGGPVELVFSPAGLPSVPDPVFPGGTYEAVARQRFSLHAVIRYDGVPGFAPLPAPPDAAAAAPAPAADGPDTDRDDLVEVGADLASWGPDTGTIAVRPEWLHPQVLLPLGVALWDCLPVHAYLCQGGFDDRPETAWKHPDAGPLWFACSLHTRAYVERLVRTAGARRKVAEVVRPRGNRIAFEFPWDAAAGAFSALGFPLGPNRRRTSILRDLTPADDLDACFELCFDSGIVHVFSGGSRAEGTLRQVRHDDGRAVRLDALTECAFGLDGSRFTSPRCTGTLTWAAGRLVRLDYAWRCGSGTLGVDLLYGPTPRGAWVTRLAKSIPGLDVAHTGSFGFQGATQTVTHGSGVVVSRSGGRIVTTRPDGGSVAEVTTLNADGLPIRLETFANGGSHAVGFHYSGGSGRHPANGAAAWAHLTRIDHPDGAWERFGYDPQTGWLTEVVAPFGNAPPEAAESLCRVTRFAYDRALSAGLAPDPARLTERPRRAVTETLGVETARTCHAYETEGPAGRSVRRRRCVAAGAAWDAAGNLETVTRFNRYGPPDLQTPTGSTRWTATPPADDRIVLTESCSSGRRTVRTLNALGEVLARQTSESGAGVTLVTDEAYSGIDPFGRIARTDYLDGTWEAFLDRQWHGGPLRQRCRDGSEAVCTYTPDGALASVTRYGVTTSFRYDDLGRVSGERRRAGTLAVQSRARFDSRGRQTLVEDELGRRTLTTYNGSRCRTLHPDGSWTELERFLDGTPARLSGDAVAETLYEYGVDPAAGAWSCVRRRSAFGFIDRSFAWHDLLGRPWQTARTVGGGPPETMTTTFFDAQGRPCRRVDADGVTTLTTYNSRNEVAAVALDLDRDGAVGSADRITAYRRRAAWSALPGGADPVPCLVTSVSGPAPDAVAETAVAVDGRQHGSTVNGRTTATRTTLGAGPGERTVTTTFPDGTAAVETYAEGLLRRRTRLDAGGRETASETLEYDALRRLVRRRDDTTGVVSEIALDAAGRVTAATRSDAPGSERYDYDPMGRLTRLRQRGGGEVRYEYEPSGLLHRESGSGTLPRRWQYDPRGLCTGLWTWRGGLDGAGAVLTEWVYDAHSGRLSDRKLGGLTVEEYRYSKAGRLERLIRRTAAGDVVTDLARDAAGEVAAVTHSDGSGGAATVCDPAGRPLQVADAVGTRRFTCDADGRVLRETLPQLPGGVLESAWDPAGRRTGLRLVVEGTTGLAWTWSFDAAGRLAGLSDGRCRARYEYRPGSDLVARTVCSRAEGPDRLLLERTWDSQARLTRLAATLPAAADSPAIASWQYDLDADGRRTRCDAALADPADPAAVRTVRWEYAYDALGQLAGAVCRNPADGAALPGRRFAYAHDTIANRVGAGRADPATGTGEETYTANDLNQYTLRTVPGAVEIAGRADPAATVTANGRPAARDGAAFHLRLPVDNAAGPVALSLVLRAVRTDPAGGPDRLAEVTATVQLPAAAETLAPAGTGGLAADSLLAYEWDASDRLVAVQSSAAVPAADRRRLEFRYDYRGRRVARKVLVWNPNTASWDPAADTRFVYDGWNLLAEFLVPPAGDPTLVRSCLWGLDLDGLRRGRPGLEAGGIGGLVAVTEWSGSPPAPGATLYAVADGNGNIAALVPAEPPGADPDGPLETVEYEPFGRVLARHRAGPGALPARAAPLCPFGFSSKYLDPETGLLYFGLRYYSPDLGRWLCRDPLGEQGGPNLYAYCHNDPVNRVDPLGLALYAFDGTRATYDSWTAVSTLHRAYLGNKEYEDGVGSGWYSLVLGGVSGVGAELRLESMYDKLVRNFKDNDRDIDIVGFSRGASLAREFANMIRRRGDPLKYRQSEVLNDYVGTQVPAQVTGSAPTIRFVGLFDTVGSFGIPGNQINPGIHMDLPDNVQRAAHAVARHERRAQFPLTPLNLSRPGQEFRERVFDGDPSDIGSGHGPATNRLSLPPLLFVWQEGREAGVPFGPLPERPWSIVDSTVPHDLTGRAIFTDGGPRGSLP